MAQVVNQIALVGRFEHLLSRAVDQPAPGVVVDEYGAVSPAQAKRGVPFPLGGEAPYLGQFVGAELLAK